MVFVVNKGYCVKYKWTKHLPGWMIPFVIKLPVLILGGAFEFFLVCPEFWDGQLGLSVFCRRQDTMQLGLEISNKGLWITGFTEDQ